MSYFHIFDSVQGLQSIAVVMGLMAVAGMLHIYADKLPSKVGTWGVFSLLMLVAALHQMLFDAIAEDAFITFRYAERLVQGDGLVFNVGENVEGYSNYLWLMLVASVHWVTGADIPLIGRVLGALLSLGGMAWTFVLATRVNMGQRSAAFVAVGFMATCSTYAAWGLAGLENGLHVVLLLAAIDLAFRGYWRSLSVMWVLLALCRIDGVVWIIPFGIWALIAGRGCSVLRRIWRLFYPFAVLYGAYTFWRVTHFGYWLPNSVAAKQGGDPLLRLGTGVAYMGQQLIAVAPWILVVFLVMFVVLERQNSTKELDALNTELDPDEVLQRVQTWLLCALLGTQVVYVVAIGGDWAPAGRFVTVLIPIAGMLLGIVWAQVTGDSAWNLARRSGRTIMVLACLGALAISYGYPGYFRTVHFWNDLVEDAAVMGTWLHDNVPADTMMISSGAGSVPYHSKLPTLDMYGITNEHVARHGKRSESIKAGHLAADQAYLLSLSPTIIFLDPFVFSKTIPTQARFYLDSRYAPILFLFDDEQGGRYVRLHIHRSAVKELAGLLTRPRHVSLVETTSP
jgi:arabinofuranosyltransferase